MISFNHALEAVRLSEAFDLRADLQECLYALQACGDDLAPDLPALARAHRKRKGPSQGTIIVETLRLGPTHKGGPTHKDLYADCYLALATWVHEWNRRHLRLV